MARVCRVVESAPDDLCRAARGREINAGCGQCACRGGDARLTEPHVSEHQGETAMQRFSIAVVNLLPVTDDVTDESAVFANAAAYE